MLKKIGKLFLFLSIAGYLHAQSVDVSVDRNVLEVDENFALTFTFKGVKSTPNLDLPVINGFQTLNGGVPSRSTNMEIVNGRISQSAALTYYLRTVAEGSFTIPSFSIDVNG
ncbi:MAG: BatD family protein, partial [Calditrichaeota bacterium]|nr:BatD family protein [Calditrichota bacterium]